MNGWHRLRVSLCCEATRGSLQKAANNHNVHTTAPVVARSSLQANWKTHTEFHGRQRLRNGLSDNQSSQLALQPSVATRANGRNPTSSEGWALALCPPIVPALVCKKSVRKSHPADLFDDHLAVHDEPVAREGAEVRVAAGLFWGFEVDDRFVFGQHDVCVSEDVVGFGDVMSDGGVWI
jgi:hypothetical protein